MKNNKLLISTLAFVAMYVVAAFTIPSPYLSSTASLVILICGLLVSIRYTPHAMSILFKNRHEGPDERGSHSAVYGISLIANGACYTGMFGLLWVLFGQPTEWLGTAYSAFGRAMMAGGFWLLFISPESVKQTIALPKTLWLIIILAAGLLMAFFLGTKIGESNDPRMSWRASYMSDYCPDHKQVLATRSMIYHTYDSPYRSMIRVPVACFTDSREAIELGYRAFR